MLLQKSLASTSGWNVPQPQPYRGGFIPVTPGIIDEINN